MLFAVLASWKRLKSSSCRVFLSSSFPPRSTRYIKTHSIIRYTLLRGIRKQEKSFLASATLNKSLLDVLPTFPRCYLHRRHQDCLPAVRGHHLHIITLSPLGLITRTAFSFLLFKCKNFRSLSPAIFAYVTKIFRDFLCALSIVSSYVHVAKHLFQSSFIIKEL